MMMLSSTKIEHRAINVLKNIIDEHSTMDYEFNENDKEMSWDGYILIYKDNNGCQSKNNSEARVPVQIKGHMDLNGKYINSKRITYSVNLDDLNAYATEKGVIYFQIFINDNKKEVFYSSLYPSKIADYIECAQKKGNKSSISIVFTKLEKNAEKLYYIVKQFNNEAMKQGTAYTPLVQDRIRSNDFDKLTSVSMTIIGAKDSCEVLSRLSTGDVCIYGKMVDDKYQRPLEWIDNSIFILGKEVNQDISINGEVFYNKYSCLVDSDGGITLRLSPNLNIRFFNGTVNFDFKVKGTIQTLGNDSEFILRLLQSKTFTIKGHSIGHIILNAEEKLQKNLAFLVDVFDTLKMIGFELNKKPSQYTDEESAQITGLVYLRKKAGYNRVEEGLSRYNWKYGNKLVPLLVFRNGKDIRFYNSVYTNQYAIYLPNDKDELSGYRMPMFAYHEVEVLSNLYKYDYNAFYEQIDNSDINEKTGNPLIEFVLTMINVYDCNGDKKFLDLADYLLERIKPYIQEELFLLNKLQIIIRRRKLQNKEVKMLVEISEDDICIAFGKYVLLGNKVKALELFDELTQEKREEYKKFPIYHLFEKL